MADTAHGGSDVRDQPVDSNQLALDTEGGTPQVISPPPFRCVSACFAAAWRTGGGCPSRPRGQYGQVAWRLYGREVTRWGEDPAA